MLPSMASPNHFQPATRSLLGRHSTRSTEPSRRDQWTSFIRQSTRLLDSIFNGFGSQRDFLRRIDKQLGANGNYIGTDPPAHRPRHSFAGVFVGMSQQSNLTNGDE